MTWTKTVLSLVGVLSIPVLAGAQDNFPELPDANAGECFAKVLIPAQYDTIDEKIVVREAAEKIDIIPAKYETVTETVTLRPAYDKLVPVPAKMKTVTETVTVREGRQVWRTGKSAKSSIAKDLTIASALAEGLPASATPGTCYTRYFQEAEYQESPQEIVVREASAKYDVTPAAYEWVEEKVLVREGTKKIVEVPAVYETVTEKVIVRPAYTTWKKGRGPIERVDHGTGEIMCRVEVPAEYKTVSRRVLKSPASTKTVDIAPEYKTVKVQKLKADWKQASQPLEAKKQTVMKRSKKSDARLGWRQSGTPGPGVTTGVTLCRAEIAPTTKTVKRQVVDVPATVKRVSVPAETKTMKVRKVVQAPQEKKTAIPAEFKIVKRRNKVSDEKLAWRPVLCETNADAALVAGLQRSLQKAGHNPGPIDGVIGTQTLAAVDEYQRAKGLARGSLTKATLDSLGVKLKSN